MAHNLPEIHEQILIKLSVRDLIRCKSVCKSWLSLISDPRFIKAHLEQSYRSDRNNDELGDRRIFISRFPRYILERQNDYFLNYLDRFLLGSSDGLVCVSPFPTKILVLNPSTREVKKLTKSKIPEIESTCWGFGYDLSTNDYKIVWGFIKGENRTYFQVFSLRFNVWKVVGEVKYAFISKIGVLCNGALHWVAYDNSSEKNVILSFHLSEEKFVEVPQPDHARYQSVIAQHASMRLGNIEDCLCVFRNIILPHDVWVMKEYNNKQSWEILKFHREIKYDAMHCLKLLAHYIPNKRSLCHTMVPSDSRMILGAPLFVESLVSPHFQKKPKRKRQTSTMKSPKVKPDNEAVALYAVPQSKADADANANACYGSCASTSANV